MTATSAPTPTRPRKRRRSELRVERSRAHHAARAARAAAGDHDIAQVMAEVDLLRAKVKKTRTTDPVAARVAAHQAVLTLQAINAALTEQAPRRSR